jgi:lipopolysaccharide transport system permease protein
MRGRPGHSDRGDRPPVKRIGPAPRWPVLDLRELWAYRHLVLLLAHRDLRVRYRQTAIGAAWAVLQPVLTMVVFALLFGKLARLPSDGLPYPVFYYSGLLPWMFVSHAVTNGTTSLHEHSRILTRVYFPRLVLPLAPVLSGLVDLAVAFTVLIGLMLWYGLWPAVTVPAVLFFVGLAVLSAAAVGVLLAAANSRYRDVKFGLAFALQAWMFASPVVYPMSVVPEHWRTLYALNPMAVVIQGFRWSLTGHHYPGHLAVIAVTFGLVLMLASGALLFRHVERHMADVI